jgi:alginate production protein
VVWGDERIVEYVELPGDKSMADDVMKRDVSGWAVDAGVNWILGWPYEPRIFVGYAIGSGDPNPDSGDDGAFRQTGIHGNESGFGGSQRFGQYGNLLEPELSNLSVVTFGVGLTFLRNSSIDLVYHYYRQVEPATFLRDARFDPELDGRHRDLGHGIDLVFAIEEWDRLELELDVAAFRSGNAFEVDRHEWTYGLFGSIRFAF